MTYIWNKNFIFNSVRILNHKTPDICWPLFFIKLKENESGSFSHVLIKLNKGEGQKSKTGGEQVISHTKYFTKALHKNRRPWNFFSGRVISKEPIEVIFVV
jgi:hypothetical protein